MNRTRFFTLAVTLGIALAGLGGCGDNESTLYLQPFSQNNIELQLNQEYTLKVLLSGTAQGTTYVDMQNPVPDQLTLTPTTVIKFDAGDAEKNLLIRANMVTNGTAELVFTLRDTTSTQAFRVQVK